MISADPADHSYLGIEQQNEQRVASTFGGSNLNVIDCLPVPM